MTRLKGIEYMSCNPYSDRDYSRLSNLSLTFIPVQSMRSRCSAKTSKARMEYCCAVHDRIMFALGNRLGEPAVYIERSIQAATFSL